jgi:hypothetical protein
MRYSRGTVSMLWFSTSGPASSTVRNDDSIPWKSGISTSIRQAGTRARVARIVSAKIDAPPSARSSRSTDVITAKRRPIRATASATRDGSAVSSSVGLPCATAQYAQARVQTSPRIMNVAVPWCQHSPMFGQWASSHTVFSFRSCMMPLRRR